MILLKKEPTWVSVQKCCCCNSILEINQQDLDVSFQNILKSDIFMYIFNCPCCGYKNKIEKQLPNYIQISTLEKIKSKLTVGKVDGCCGS